MMASAASRAAPLGIGDVAIGVDGDELGVSAIGHKLGNALGVAVAGMENNNGFGHVKNS